MKVFVKIDFKFVPKYKVIGKCQVKTSDNSQNCEGIIMMSKNKNI